LLRIATSEPCGPTTSTIVHTSPISQSSPKRPSRASICAAITLPILVASMAIRSTLLERFQRSKYRAGAARDRPRTARRAPGCSAEADLAVRAGASLRALDELQPLDRRRQQQREQPH